MIRRSFAVAFTQSLLFSVCVLVGCTTNGRNDSAKSPVVGTWVFSPSRTSPAAASDPAMAGSFTATIVFSADGTFHAAASFNGHTNEDNGTWRVAGSDVIAKSRQTDDEQRYELRGNVLVARGKNGLDVLVFERH